MTTPASGSSLPLASLGERGLVALIRSRFPAPPGLLPVGMGDDGAVVKPDRGALQVLTTDALVEGVHFDLSFCSPADVGYKALAVSVSDVAAMGGAPRYALLSLILPARLTVGDVEGLLEGFGSMAAAAGVVLAGGNITSSPGPLVIDVSLVGSVRPRKILTRGGGRPGDALYVTGTIGAAAAGLGWLRSQAGAVHPAAPDAKLAECVARYRRPEPRSRIGALLGRTRTASTCMDLSDGLADAVARTAEASGTGARIEAAGLPIHGGARRWFASEGRDPILAALEAGDDYELLFSVAPRRRRRLEAAQRLSRGVSFTRIGELTGDSEVVLLRQGVPESLPRGFTHF